MGWVHFIADCPSVTLGACGVSIIERPVVTIAAIVVLSIAHLVMK